MTHLSAAPPLRSHKRNTLVRVLWWMPRLVCSMPPPLLDVAPHSNLWPQCPMNHRQERTFTRKGAGTLRPSHPCVQARGKAHANRNTGRWECSTMSSSCPLSRLVRHLILPSPQCLTRHPQMQPQHPLSLLRLQVHRRVSLLRCPRSMWPLHLM